MLPFGNADQPQGGLALAMALAERCPTGQLAASGLARAPHTHNMSKYGAAQRRDVFPKWCILPKLVHSSYSSILTENPIIVQFV